MVPITRKGALEQVDPPRSPRETLSTMYDLPSENSEEPGLPNEFHDLQPQLLSPTLRLSGYTRDNCFTARDLNLYADAYAFRGNLRILQDNEQGALEDLQKALEIYKTRGDLIMAHSMEQLIESIREEHQLGK